MPQSDNPWFPLFEFTKYLYRSILVLHSDADPAGPLVLKEWAKADFQCGQAFHDGDEGYRLGGGLVLRPGIELEVNIRGRKGRGTGPGTFEAIGTGMAGVTIGAVYEFTGLIYPAGDPSSSAGAARIASIRGSVKATKGPAAIPGAELGGQPLGTVGAFVIVPIGPAG
jgi:hypothetical protein